MNATCWQKFSALIVRQSRHRAHDPGLFAEILSGLRGIAKAAEVIYLREDDRDDHGRFFVAGDSIPGRNFLASDCNSVHPALGKLIEVILPSEHELEDQVSLQDLGERGPAHVFQIRFAEIGSRHILALFEQPSQPFSTPTDEERACAYEALTVMAHVHNSLDFARAKTLRDERRKILERIMQVQGTVDEVAEELCLAWRKFLGVPAVRLWIYNKTLDELDLLSEACDPNDQPFLAQLSNRLPTKSFGGRTLNAREVLGSANPTEEPDWNWDDTHSLEVLKRWPHLLCVPLILSGSRVGISGQDPDDKASGLYGIIDVHLADLTTVTQPYYRLKFLGEMSASALDHAHLHERRRAILALNNLAQDLILDSVRKSLRLARLAYLERLRLLILNAVNANSLSIFEYDENQNLLQCIVTTGIAGHPEPNDVSYRKGEGVTWTVFEVPTQILVQDIRKHEHYRGKFRESRIIDAEEHLDPFLAVPLPGRDKRSIGVIRVLERRCDCYPHHLQNFTFFDMDLLQQIAGQVSPIFQMLRLAFHLEALNGRVEHQLIQPIHGARAYVENLLDNVYGPISAEVEQKLKYVQGMLLDTSDRVRTGKWGRHAEAEQLTLIRPAARRPQRLARYLLSRIIDVQSLRHGDRVSVNLVDRPSLDTAIFMGDDQYLAQAIGNVLHNAVKYAYPQTAVLLKADRDQDCLIVNITSVGLPIAPRERERIFEDRQRGILAMKHDKFLAGSGQGLYIARQYLRGLGGDLILHESEIIHPAEVTPPANFPPAARTTFRLILEGAFPR